MPLPRKRADIAENLSGAECFLYDNAGRTLSVLNASALVIWSLCDGTHTPDAMLHLLARIYPETSREQLKADLHTALADFARRGLLAPG